MSKPIKKTILYLVVLLFLTELFFVTAVFLGGPFEFAVYGYNMDNVVPFNQVIDDNTLQVSVGKIYPTDYNLITEGSLIVAYNDINTEYLWVEIVVSIDFDNQTLITSANDTFGSRTISFADIKGIYLGDTNLFELFIFISGYDWIYFLNIGTALFVSLLLYFWSIQTKKIPNISTIRLSDLIISTAIKEMTKRKGPIAFSLLYKAITHELSINGFDLVTSRPQILLTLNREIGKTFEHVQIKADNPTKFWVLKESEPKFSNVKPS